MLGPAFKQDWGEADILSLSSTKEMSHSRLCFGFCFAPLLRNSESENDIVGNRQVMAAIVQISEVKIKSKSARSHPHAQVHP